MNVKQVYLSSALMCFNTLVVFAVFNLGLGLIYGIADHAKASQKTQTPPVASAKLFHDDGSPVDNGKRFDYQLTWFDYRGYDNIVDPAYAAQVLDDFYDLSRLGFIYQPWVEFSEPPFSGKLVHIDSNEQGIPHRRTLNPPNAKAHPVRRIFIFGGSSTFGYNVSDEHTWPTVLSTLLNRRAQDEGLDAHIEVTNYGRGFFYPSQEAALLLDLLKFGYRPDMAIFMDGVNKGTDADTPFFTDKFERNFRNMQFAPASKKRAEATTSLTHTLSQFRWLPAIRLVFSLQYRLDRGETAAHSNAVQKSPNSAATRRATDAELTEKISHYLNRFEQNRRVTQAICDLYDIDALFFLQPSWGYRYDLRHYRPSLRQYLDAPQQEETLFYEKMHTQQGIIFLDHLFQLWGEENRAIIDDCHYSPTFNEFLAQQVANRINLRELIEKRAPRFIQEEQRAGMKRRFPGKTLDEDGKEIQY